MPDKETGERPDFVVEKSPSGGWEAAAVSVRALHWSSGNYAERFDGNRQALHLTLFETNEFLRKARTASLRVDYKGPNGTIHF